jgi:hypothetical protein
MFPGIFNPIFDSADVTIRPSILCPKCKPLREWVQRNWHKSWSTVEDPRLFAHHASTKLPEERVRGCHLCTLLLHGIVEDKSWKVAFQGADRLSTAEIQLLKLSMIKGANFWVTYGWARGFFSHDERLPADVLEIHKSSHALDES